MGKQDKKGDKYEKSEAGWVIKEGRRVGEMREEDA